MNNGTVTAKAAPKAALKTDWDIANAAQLWPIARIAQERLGIPLEAIEPYGLTKAKIGMAFIRQALAKKATGRLVLVTAISPTPAGEGKTTTTVGLGDALNRIGKKAAICLREASLGPCFGMKGGAAGGGYAQVVPMDDINLHFTGDLHAIGAANNLLAALIDNHIYWGNALDIDSRRVTWRRCMDMNDRALREIVTSLGGASNGFPRESGFDITAASEIMAILCLSTSLEDLQRRLANIVLGSTRERKPVRAGDLKAEGALVALLKDALKPNLVQTLENNPAFVHGGPFANIAHGCNSVIATSLALRVADYVVTESGFGADLGAEKFFDIKCRKAGLTPEVAVVVASVRALKMHGGVGKNELATSNATAVTKGLVNLRRHLENLARFGVPAVVCVNRFGTDTEAELAAVVDGCAAVGVKAVVCEHFARGGAGAEDLARAVVAIVEQGKADFKPLYALELPLAKKIETIAMQIYGAGEVVIPKPVADRLKEFEQMGFGNLPVCMAKTQYSFSADPELRGAPSGFVLPVREVRLSAGAEFVVVICGEIMTMPGLPRAPSAEGISVSPDGLISGLS
ncbi:MAG TPA: formate--tetrahydrofolate ligase [Steroidobacteraceae bacterium]|jgi:formate--tetrahydrofolate ligase|nr:formate--tetrahydrofolate ligase [Steroidobacteraceae bacterium]